MAESGGFCLIVKILCLSSLIRAYPTVDNEIDATISSDLSYLGSAIFGAPNLEIGSKLENWTDTHPENPEEFGEYAEGDILFPQKSRNGLLAESARWKNGVVPYEIAGSFSSKDREIIQRALSIYHKYTCIKFRPRIVADVDYISIVGGRSGCWSSVGRISGKQEVNLQSPYCTTKVGTPLHELMHAVGFLHEQNRYERDDYVTIEWQNIKNGHENNFNKADKDSTYGFGVPYDYRSVMHYSPNAFSVNGKPTIIPKDYSKNLKMGQREGFSRGDIEKINAMYGCPKKDLNNNNNNNNNNIHSGDGDKDDNNKGGGGLLSFLFELVTN